MNPMNPGLRGGGASLLNWPQIRRRLLSGAEESLDMALDQAEKDAKDFAPVRDVFVGGRGRSGLTPSQEDDATAKRGNARSGHPKLLAERGKKIMRKSLAEQESFLKWVKHQQAPRHEYNILEVNELGSPTGRTRRFRGSARSFNPVVMDLQGTPRAGGPVVLTGPQVGRATKGGKTTEGNIREVTGIEVGPSGVRFARPTTDAPFYQRAHSPLTAEGRPLLLEPVGRGEKDRPKAVERGTVEDYLSYRGRNEIARLVKVANQGKNPLVGEGNAATFTTAGGQVLLGGRLRDEIHRTPIKVTEKRIYGWVISPTSYAKYQEYGTSRHRAQPYMRPALYKARQSLPRLMRQHMGRKVW